MHDDLHHLCLLDELHVEVIGVAELVVGEVLEDLLLQLLLALLLGLAHQDLEPVVDVLLLRYVVS